MAKRMRGFLAYVWGWYADLPWRGNNASKASKMSFRSSKIHSTGLNRSSKKRAVAVHIFSNVQRCTNAHFFVEFPAAECG
jgi:hypothetical protein